MMNAAAKLADSVLGKVPTSTPMQPKVDESRPMNAIIWHGKNEVKYVQKPTPVITDVTDVTIRVTSTTICGSDLHLYSGAMPNMHDGDILGHEFMGIVEEVGSAVKNIKKGQRVAVAFDIACGDCVYCKREEYTACDTTNPSKLMEAMTGHRSAALYGYSHTTGGVAGGQADYVRVPFADVNCLVIPDDVPDEKALYLTDVIPTSYFACHMADVRPGCSVAIWGLGPIGLMAARWAQTMGAAKVIGIDFVPERLNLATQILKIDVINYKEQNVLKTIAEMCPHGVDCAIEAAGFEYAKTMKHKIEMAIGLETDTSDILNECITAVRKFGTVSIVGVYTGFTNHFAIGALMEKGLTVRGGQSPTQRFWKMCLEKIQSGEIDPTFMITHKLPLSAAPDFYAKMQKREGGAIKCFMRPDALHAPNSTL